jgi:hypothetical protein
MPPKHFRTETYSIYKLLVNYRTAHYYRKSHSHIRGKVIKREQEIPVGWGGGRDPMTTAPLGVSFTAASCFIIYSVVRSRKENLAGPNQIKARGKLGHEPPQQKICASLKHLL